MEDSRDGAGWMEYWRLLEIKQRDNMDVPIEDNMDKVFKWVVVVKVNRDEAVEDNMGCGIESRIIQ